MIRILLLLVSLPVFSAVNLELYFHPTKVKQGEILEAELQINSSSLAELPMSAITGKKIADILYVISIAPPLKKETESIYRSQARVIFLKVPQTLSAVDTVDGKNLQVSWNKIDIEPTTAPGSFILGDFTIPQRSRIILYLIFLLIVALPLGWIILRMVRKQREKNNRRQQLSKQKEQILQCRNFEEIVELWKNKHAHFNSFPHIREPFSTFEQELNACQFKPTVTDAEKKHVLLSYRHFITQVEGGFDGV